MASGMLLERWVYTTTCIHGDHARSLATYFRILQTMQGKREVTGHRTLLFPFRQTNQQKNVQRDARWMRDPRIQPKEYTVFGWVWASVWYAVAQVEAMFAIHCCAI